MVGLVRAVLAAVGAAIVAIGGADIADAGTTTSSSVAVATVMSPQPGQVVGIAAPVIIRFSTVVADRVAAERGIAIDTPAEVPGEFTWIGDRVVQWTPQDFWPAYTPVTVRTGGMATSFDVGAAVMAVADISAHTFTVSMDGQTVREMPASLGKPGFDTPQGTFKVLEKQRRVKFDSRTIGIPLDSPEGYLIDGEYAVRVTWGGVYVHSAPWSVGSQGNANVSHGCINLSPDNAAWYFDTVSIGDPVIVEA
ncbi:L,D-transpeptidase [Mycobacterium sp. 29Ha]|nr:L,D-transpeptidase [Mycobacterium sp. 29Ha]